MATDLFDQLAETEVPSPPVQLERTVHQRLNRALLVQHLWHFVLGALPWVVVRVVPAMVAGLVTAIFGRYPKRPDGNRT